jgi:hypothetical protein
MSSDLLHPDIAGGPNPQVLARVQMNVPAALAEHARSADSGADGRAHRGAYSASGNCANDCANARCGADFLHVIFSRTLSLNSAFSIDLADTLARTVGHNFDYLRAHLCSSTVDESNLLEPELQLGGALYPRGPLHAYHATFNRRALIFFRLDYAHLKAIAFL